MKNLLILFSLLSFSILINSNEFELPFSHPSKELFLAARTPSFLGIFATNYKETKIKILELILEELQFFPDSNALFSENPRDFFSTNYTFPPTFHITTFYLGGDKSKMSSPFYTNFVENQQFIIGLDAVIIVPGKIITGVTFPDRSKIMIENKFPHVTLMCDEWDAVDSNALMTALFDDGRPLNQYYSTDFFESSQPFFEKFNMEITSSKGTEQVDVYLIKSAPALQLEAVTKKGY